jgi:rhamnopyranosyl-N-acetylglucosaminyl-diphospho-decaprenol beta-1,3/1,4-galactofuranosyltransferase
LVWAVVVTFERRDLLRQCLAALQAQTAPPARILVVDNASTDGTPAMVREEFAGVDLLELAENGGGSAGFDAGLRAALDGGATHVWMLDDDTIARPDSLERLLDALEIEPHAALLASAVEWSDGSLHPMNLPGLRRDDVQALIDGAAKGLLPIRTATFVSLLISRAAIERHGGPPRHFFLWSDDMEFTARITRDGAPAFLVPDSVVEHRTRIAHTAVTEGGPRFYYHVRNTLFMLRGDAWSAAEKLSLVYLLAVTTAGYLRRERRAGLGHVIAGLRDGVRLVGGRR